MSNFIKIPPVKAEFFHADGQTDMTNLIDASRNIAEATDNCGLSLIFKNISMRSNLMCRNM